MKLLSNENRDYATFLPAISGFYTDVLGRWRHQEGYMPADRNPAGFENDLAGLNFLDPELGYFYYDKCLYSAGHAYLKLDQSDRLEWMIQERDKKKVTVVGDSGGFQIGKGVIKFDWEHFYEKKGDKGYKGTADKTRQEILDWLEHTADWSMVLDVPSWAYLEKTARERTGLRSFQDCLKATLHNNDYFVQHRQGKTKFLNVLQGTSWNDTQLWYDAVKDYPFEGWAMGGNNIRDVEIALKRLIIMRDEGKLEGKDWIHFLGTSKLEWAIMLTAIQRELREHVNPNVTISFDCASPFIATANGLVYTHNILTNDRFSYIMDSCFDNKGFKNSKMPFPFESEVGKRLTVGDICRYGPGDLNKIGKEGKTSWDSFSYAMIMAHNVYLHIRAVQRANQLVDIEFAHHDPDYRTWNKAKRKEKSAELSQWVPRNLLFFNNFVKQLFTSQTPMSLIEDASPLLQQMNNNRYNDGNTPLFQSLFEEIIFTADDTSFEREDDKLDELEHMVREEG
jgi:hypothetical protein